MALVAAPAVLMAGDWKPSWRPWVPRKDAWRPGDTFRMHGQSYVVTRADNVEFKRDGSIGVRRFGRRACLDFEPMSRYYRGRQWDPLIVVKPPVTLPPNYKSPARLYLESILRGWERR